MAHENNGAMFSDLERMERRLATYAATVGYMLGENTPLQHELQGAQRSVKSASARLERMAELVPALDDIASRSAGNATGQSGV
ncbi:hypothetical protein BH789_gp082 [Gordonia phage GMA6]|uniref:Uncharacterized protein n=1 Tax=Gordonia phage GMA6 TaxID=1647285 RepID=A0A0K0NLA1_9CAUD|nr:hypothetical protein BH789_gp082 [Gordonia phage GMA6]AKL88363.1 hypothetical protein GMA6_82 [Gordonia phage GMA6]